MMGTATLLSVLTNKEPNDSAADSLCIYHGRSHQLLSETGR